MPTDAFKSIFNDGFDTQIPDGTDGNQAQLGIFFLDELGRFRRITQAEGNEISYNPEPSRETSSPTRTRRSS